MNLRIKLLTFITLLTLFGCISPRENIENESNNSATTTTETLRKLTGPNINWRFLPELNKNILNTVASLNQNIIRYPGGSVSKTWNWEDGTSSKSGNSAPHNLDDLVLMQKATNAKVTFVLNIIHKTLQNQLELLRTAKDMGIPIEYIEMGNEHYLGKGGNVDDSGKHQDNVTAFPTGKEYAELVNVWAPAIRKEFPDVKIGITMLVRTSKNNRLSTWNNLIIDTIESKNFDAYIYHIYVNPDNSLELNDTNIAEIIKERTDIFEFEKIDDPSKEVWITEYGVHTDTLEKTVILYKALADYIEVHADVAMPQVLYKKVDSFTTMIAPPDATSLTELGKMFSKRWK